VTAEAPALPERPPAPPPVGRHLALLSLGALGVVYGDIGTSPLYALREALHPQHGVAASSDNVLGILSLILWSLVLVISIKYLILVMRVDQQGEGGILVLTSMLAPAGRSRRRWLLLAVGIFGTALLYGDGMITPAISVLSAVEGLEVTSEGLQPYVLEITVVILAVLFLVQRRGTGTVGAMFGPVMVMWFASLAVLGSGQIVAHPQVLAAVNPVQAIRFFGNNGFTGFAVLGSVFLVVTGGEALYADMGHFGRRPIRLAWFSLVLPALLLNYFGQGALILGDPAAIDQPFFRLAPDFARIPLIVLAAAAAVIASQALISGAFSLAMQSVQLGYLPRLHVEHTSARQRGQVYVPAVNWGLMVACILLVVGFRSSSHLAAAYGVAVTMTMTITTVLFSVTARERWHWPRPVVALVSAALLTIDLGFLGANLLKVPKGGWFPLVAGAAVFIVMTTWKRGRELVSDRLRAGDIPLETFAESLEEHPPTSVPGTAVYLYSRPLAAPPALVANLRYNHVVHERVITVAVQVEGVPRVHPVRRVEILPIRGPFVQVIVHVGFMEPPSVPAALAQRASDLGFHPMATTYVLGRETVLVTPRPGMAIWREHLFALLSRNARSAATYFRVPSDRVVEVGVQVEI
jgi:KUP system potassium uptake protein